MFCFAVQHFGERGRYFFLLEKLWVEVAARYSTYAFHLLDDNVEGFGTEVVFDEALKSPDLSVEAILRDLVIVELK